jgi:RHS repeat-associated protein
MCFNKPKYLFFPFIVLLLATDFGFAQPTSLHNYVIANSVKQAGITTESAVNALPIATQGKTQTIAYLNGLGRPLQSVITQGSATQKDVVTSFEYDVYGREVKKYLPYADQSSTTYGSYKTNASTSQATFYNGGIPNVDADNAPYSIAVPESSPLNRTFAQGAPGTAWQPNTSNPYDASTHVSQFQYLIGKAVDQVRLFNVDSAGNITSSTYYADGQLYLKVSTDEQQQSVKEYTDKSGRVILKRVMISGDSLQTYYLYDNLDILRAVIQPEGTATLQAASWVFPSGFSAKWMFLYRYDQRSRMVMKKVPGADSVNMIYDQWDRVVLTQDGNLRTTHNYLFTKYDQLNRPVVTGEITDTRAQSAVIADVAASSARFESVNTSATQGYTLNNSFPSSGSYTLTVCTTTHYDSYSNLPSWSSGYSFVNEDGISAENTFLSGQVVATQELILGTNNYNRTVNYYDDKYRLIQTIFDNADGGQDRITKILSFDGKVTSDYHNHTSRFYTTPLLIQQTYSYDHMDRLLNTTHQTASQEVVTVSQNTYNELGQLLNKKIHQAADHTNPLQKLDYYYNIRGWLNSINRPISSETGYEESDLFNMELHYNTGLSMPYSTAYFNGNISEEVWKGGYDEYYRDYRLTYDQANRMTDATYGYKFIDQYGAEWSLTKRYNESDISYDHNGNLIFLTRYHGDWNKIDYLAYQNYNGNQLGAVSDWSGSPSPVGFQDKNNGGNDYTYDANGNLTSDYNKSITSITYNYLNLPNVVTITSKGTITYTYDAAGNKLQKTTVDQTVTPNKTTNYYYAGDFVYRNDTLEFVSNPEGRLRPVRIDTTQAISISNLKYIYDYFLKDHLGSVRDVLTTEQQTDLYAATMETAAATKENALFSNVSSTAASVPSGFTNDNNNKMASKLNGAVNITGNSRVGPSIVLKVMTGDTISISTWSWYTGPVQPAATGVSDIANDLLPLLTGGVTAEGGNHGGAIPTGTSNPLLSQALGSFLSNDRPYNTSRPKAFLNWMVVDEEFAGVTSTNHMGAIQIPVTNTGDTLKQVVGPMSMVIRRNGWIYIYLSNESAEDVYFDNLVVNLKHGPLLEQQDYYPFGMEIPGLSTQAFKYQYKPNRYNYNGKEEQSKEFSDSSGLSWDDYGARMYDPQIGRWVHLDPLADPSRRWSPYTFSFDNPIRYIDPDGMLPNDVGADGLTNEQWIDASRPGANKNMAIDFRQENDQDNGGKKKTTTDAGHGVNGDTGAVDGTEYEKVYALKIEKAIDTWLGLFGLDNTRTRTGDVKYPDPYNWRYENANNHGAEAFISIHLNGGTTDPSFYAIYQQGKSNVPESIKLANSIVNSITGVMSVNDHAVETTFEGTRFVHLAVLSGFSGKAGVLLEFGSVQNASNRAFINKNLNLISYVVAIGIYKYLNNGNLPELHLNSK